MNIYQGQCKVFVSNLPEDYCKQLRVHYTVDHTWHLPPQVDYPINNIVKNEIEYPKKHIINHENTFLCTIEIIYF